MSYVDRGKRRDIARRVLFSGRHVDIDTLRASFVVKRIAFGYNAFDSMVQTLRKKATVYEKIGEAFYGGDAATEHAGAVGIYTSYKVIIDGIEVVVSEQLERMYASAVYVAVKTKADYQRLLAAIKEQA